MVSDSIVMNDIHATKRYKIRKIFSNIFFEVNKFLILLSLEIIYI